MQQYMKLYSVHKNACCYWLALAKRELQDRVIRSETDIYFGCITAIGTAQT
jgi:hypothetical protein